jgi:hypothetical protein
MHFMELIGIGLFLVSSVFAKPIQFDKINFDSIVVQAWDVDYLLSDTGYSYLKLDSILTKLDSIYFNEIIRNINKTIETGEGKGKSIALPIFVCGDGLPFCGIIKGYGKTNLKIELYLSCPTSDLQCKLFNGTKEYDITLNSKFQIKLKELIYRTRLKIFNKSRLFEQSFEDIMKNKNYKIKKP